MIKDGVEAHRAIVDTVMGPLEHVVLADVITSDGRPLDARVHETPFLRSHALELECESARRTTTRG